MKTLEFRSLVMSVVAFVALFITWLFDIFSVKTMILLGTACIWFMLIHIAVKFGEIKK
jgi:hypothetical protein